MTLGLEGIIPVVEHIVQPMARPGGAERDAFV